MKRRHFLKSVALTGTAGLILPRTTIFGADAPSNKLNIALIGTWGRASEHFGTCSRENVVALCDVNEEHLAFGVDKLKQFPNVKTYVDWRKCLEQKDINAVVICTCDHTHAFITNWALNRDMHVYCEKPLGITVEEARVVRANYLKKKNKLATQVGTQRHEYENFNRVQELIRDGIIGDLVAASAWDARQNRAKGYPAGEGEPPKYLHWDLWIGPAPFHPYSKQYFRHGPGMNCLSWNMFWDFATGQVGDMGSHTMDIIWNAIEAGLPTSAEAKQGDPYNPEVCPVKLQTDFQIPKNDWRPEIKVSWYQGGALPEKPIDYVDLKRMGNGALFEGSKGFLLCDFTTRAILPTRGGANMTYYKPRSKEALLPPLGNFQRQWVNAAKSSNPAATDCNFEYAGNMIEMMNLGLVAYRVGRKLDYDPVAGQVKNDPEANALLKRNYREGWTLNG